MEEGKKVEAIKLWREKTGASLKESKMQIEQFERNGTWTPIATVPSSAETSATLESNEDIDEEIDNVDPVARQSLGIGYWLVVLILLVFLATRLLS